jgi:FHA domain
MPRLVVNPDTPDAWTVELTPGILSLGRSESNDITIDHASVSSSHCQVRVTDDGVVLKDLGSTSGTFVNGELVEEARLQPGQIIRMGEIGLRFEGETVQIDAGPPVPPALPSRTAASATPASGSVCRFHPRAPARFACPKCGRSFCELCVTTRPVPGGAKILCRSCGVECHPVQQQSPAPETSAGFFKSLPRALIYPFQGSGVLLLVFGTLFFLLLGWLPLLGVIVTGYMFNYSKSIITSTAQGRSELPDWPDFSDWKEDILVPYVQLLALVALFFGPAFLIAVWRLGAEAQLGVGFLAALAFGALLAPMGMLALAMFDTISALNPVALVWSIIRVPIPYFTAAAAFELAFLFHAFADGALKFILPIPLLPGLLSGFLYLYLAAVGMRVLGLLYRHYRSELGWFRQDRLPRA